MNAINNLEPEQEDECLVAFTQWWFQYAGRSLMPALTTQRLNGMVFSDIESDTAWKAWRACWKHIKEQNNDSTR